MPNPKEIKKKIDFDSDGKSNNGRNRPQRHCTTKTSVVSSNVVDLLKCSSASFDHLIGEGAATSNISSNQKLKLNKKQQDKLKLKMLLGLNANIVHADGVSLSEGTEGSFEEESDHPIVNREVVQGAELASKIAPPLDVQTKGALSDDKQGDTEHQVQPTSGNNFILSGSGFKNNNEQSGDQQKGEVLAMKVKENSISVEQNTATKETIHEAEKDQGLQVGSETKSVKNSENGNQKAENALISESSFLDATVPIFAETEVQTDPCYILCTCIKCKDTLNKFLTFINRGFSNDCIVDKSDRTLDQGKNDESRLSLSCVSQSHQEEERMPLFKGSKIQISVTAKAKLRSLDKNPNSSPKDFVYAIMDDLYQPLEMANMTAAGRGKGKGKGMEKWVREGIIVYLQNKFEDIDNINAWVNAKCYCERRKKWGEGAAEVRPRLTKNTKSKETEDQSGKKDKDKKKRRRSHEKERSLKKKERSADKNAELNLKKRKRVSDDTEGSSHKMRKKDSNTKDEGKGSKKRKFESAAQEKRPSGKDGKSKEKSSRITLVNDSPPRKTASAKRRISSNERPTVGGKCPKPAAELLRLNALTEEDNEQPQASKKVMCFENKNGKKKKLMPENELRTTFATSTPFAKKAGNPSISDFKVLKEKEPEGETSEDSEDSDDSDDSSEGEEEEEEEDDDDEDDNGEEHDDNNKQDDSVSDLTDD